MNEEKQICERSAFNKEGCGPLNVDETLMLLDVFKLFIRYSIAEKTMPALKKSFESMHKKIINNKDKAKKQPLFKNLYESYFIARIGKYICNQQLKLKVYNLIRNRAHGKSPKVPITSISKSRPLASTVCYDIEMLLKMQQNVKDYWRKLEGNSFIKSSISA